VWELGEAGVPFAVGRALFGEENLGDVLRNGGAYFASSGRKVMFKGAISCGEAFLGAIKVVVLGPKLKKSWARI
jgi:hypothetical protein